MRPEAGMSRESLTEAIDRLDGVLLRMSVSLRSRNSTGMSIDVRRCYVEPGTTQQQCQ